MPDAWGRAESIPRRLRAGKQRRTLVVPWIRDAGADQEVSETYLGFHATDRPFGVATAAELRLLDKGKLADIVAIPGDPATDIIATERVFFMMKEGEIVKNVAR